jgi:hypothetical protein
MTDYVTLPGIGSDIAVNDIGGKKYQRVKLIHGADGVNDGDVSTSNPFPITAPNALPISAASPIPVSASTPIPVSAPSALQVTASAALPVDATGELVEAIEAMRMAIQSLNRSIGMMTVDVAGRLRMDLTSSTGASAISFAGVSTVTTVTTLANQTNIGGISAADQMPALYKIAGESLRRNITVS